MSFNDFNLYVHGKIFFFFFLIQTKQIIGDRNEA